MDVAEGTCDSYVRFETHTVRGLQIRFEVDVLGLDSYSSAGYLQVVSGAQTRFDVSDAAFCSYSVDGEQMRSIEQALSLEMVGVVDSN